MWLMVSFSVLGIGLPTWDQVVADVRALAAPMPELERSIVPKRAPEGVDQVGEDRVLALEVDVERPLGDSCGLRDLHDRGPFVAILTEHPLGRFEELGPRPLATRSES